ncbi:hypothetical protein ACFO5R_10925 [Halosolutus amylolyticus]|uniref:Uncharacterized protein n=1 Tax=Halosolutus amylolyticus TaxID=2932267 RepID=A0ABD5PPS4_9EURY|nr:hypothetical protein [Halosolutus amylolyticus]
MVTTGDRADVLKSASTVTTLIDATLEFAKGRRTSGLLLLGAAAISSRIPGIGTAASLLLRAYRQLR